MKFKHVTIPSLFQYRDQIRLLYHLTRGTNNQKEFVRLIWHSKILLDYKEKLRHQNTELNRKINGIRRQYTRKQVKEMKSERIAIRRMISSISKPQFERTYRYRTNNPTNTTELNRFEFN